MPRTAIIPLIVCAVALCLAAQPVPTYLITTVAGTTQAGATGDGGPATAAEFAGSDATVGPGGDIYVNAYTLVRKVSTDGRLYSVAGLGQDWGISTGDGGPALHASIQATDIAFDSMGNLFILEWETNRVRKVTLDGIINTIVGPGERSYCGDGGPATQACFDRPLAIAVDAGGNLYISDSSNHRVRMVNSAGMISTIAGNGQQSFEGDGGLAAQASVGSPGDLALDTAGNLYVVESAFNRVRMVTPQGIIRTVAGNGTKGFGGDGVRAVSGPLSPSGIAVDAAGNLYIAEYENKRVRKVTPQGIITTVAGTGDTGLRGDGGPATQAWLEPTDVAVDAARNLYISDSNRLRKVTPDGIINTIAGGGTGDGGPAYKARLSPLADVTLDSDGNLYIAEAGAHRVRRVAPDGTIHTAAGMAIAGYAGDDVPATDALLNTPSGVAVDRAGNLYIADTDNNRIRKVDQSGIISTFAGTGVPGLSGDGGLATIARLSSPRGLALDSFGNLYIADTGNHRIRMVTPSGVISTVAGSDPGSAGDGGPATQAKLRDPSRIAVDPDGSLYIADTSNSRIRKVAVGGLISTLAGDGGELLRPVGVALDKDRNLFITDSGRYRIFRLSPGGTPVAIAGNGTTHGISGDAGPAIAAQVPEPEGIVAGSKGEVYFTDKYGLGFLRKLEPANIFPTGVVSAASFLPQFIAPGEIVSIFWADMGPATPAAASPGPDGRFPTFLADTKVFFDDIQAPLLYVDRNQINAIVPYGLAGRAGTHLYVEYQGRKSNIVELSMAPTSPALFTLGASGQGAILNQDFTVNSASNPAATGSIVMLYATGEGQTSPPGVDGLIAGGQPPKPVLPVTVQMNRIEAEVLYAGGVQTLVAGVIQVNVRVPQNVAPGNSVFVVIQAGGASSQRGVKIAVK